MMMIDGQAGKVHEKGPVAALHKKASRGRVHAKPKIVATDETSKKAVQDGVKLLKETKEVLYRSVSWISTSTSHDRILCCAVL